MANEGELEIFLNSAIVERAAKAIDDAIDTIGVHASSAAARFESSFDRAYGRIRSSAQTAAAYVKGQFEDFGNSFGQILNLSIGTSLGQLLSNAITGALRGVVNLIEDALRAARTFFEFSIEKAKTLTDAQLILREAVAETGGSFADAERQSTAFARAIGTTTANAERLRAVSERGLFGTGIDPDKFLRAAADLNARRGGSPDDLESSVQAVLLGQAKGVNKLFGGEERTQTVLSTYAASLGKTSSALDDVQRKSALVEEVIAKGGESAGAAAARLQTLGGMLEQVSALATDFAAKFGQALGRNQGVLELVGGVRATLLGLLNDQAKFNEFLNRAAALFVNIGEVAIPVLANIAKFGVYLYAGLQTALPQIKLFTLGVSQAIEDLVEGSKVSVLKGVAEIVRTVGGGFAGTVGIGDVIAAQANAIAERIDTAAAGIQENALVRQQKRAESIAILNAQIDQQIAPLQGVPEVIDAVAARALKALPDFAKFAKETPTLAAEGVTKVAVATEAAIEAARTKLAPFVDQISKLQQQSLEIDGDPAAKFSKAIDEADKRVDAFKKSTKDLADAVKGPLVQAFEAASEDLLTKTLRSLRDEVRLTLQEIQDAEDRFLGRDAAGPDRSSELRSRILAAQGLDANGNFASTIDVGKAGRDLLGFIDKNKINVGDLSIDAQSVVAGIRSRERSDLTSALARATAQVEGSRALLDSTALTAAQPPAPPVPPAQKQPVTPPVLEVVDPKAKARSAVVDTLLGVVASAGPASILNGLKKLSTEGLRIGLDIKSSYSLDVKAPDKTTQNYISRPPA